MTNNSISTSDSGHDSKKEKRELTRMEKSAEAGVVAGKNAIPVIFGSVVAIPLLALGFPVLGVGALLPAIIGGGSAAILSAHAMFRSNATAEPRTNFGGVSLFGSSDNTEQGHTSAPASISNFRLF